MRTTIVTSPLGTPRSLRRSARKHTQNDYEVDDLVTKRRLESLENDNFTQETVILEEVEQVEQDSDEPEFSTPKKKKKIRKKGKADKLKEKYFLRRNLETVLYSEKVDQLPPDVPSYYNCNAAPSKKPKRHFCSICGYFANYTCTKCGMRFCCVKCKDSHEESRCQKFVA